MTQRTNNHYVEIEGPPEQIRLLCDCGQVIKNRRDTFLPGAHQAICLACGNVSSEVKLLTGEVRSITTESYRSP